MRGTTGHVNDNPHRQRTVCRGVLQYAPAPVRLNLRLRYRSPQILRRSPVLLLAAVCISMISGIDARADDLIWTITPGIGHDRFTETFYLDDSTSVSIDSLERIKLTVSVNRMLRWD